MEMIDFYYYNLGEEPEDEDKEVTLKTFDYLKDNGYTDKDIARLMHYFPVKMALTPQDLPDYLWEGSLVKRDTYYYHNELHINSRKGYYDVENDKIVEFPFYQEMKIKYSKEDILKYFYSKFPLDSSLIDSKKDLGAIDYLFNKYRKIDFIDSLDFILFLIDTAKDQEADIINILDLIRYEKINLEYLHSKVAEATAKNNNVITWR